MIKTSLSPDQTWRKNLVWFTRGIELAISHLTPCTIRTFGHGDPCKKTRLLILLLRPLLPTVWDRSKPRPLDTIHRNVSLLPLHVQQDSPYSFGKILRTTVNVGRAKRRTVEEFSNPPVPHNVYNIIVSVGVVAARRSRAIVFGNVYSKLEWGRGKHGSVSREPTTTRFVRAYGHTDTPNYTRTCWNIIAFCFSPQNPRRPPDCFVYGVLPRPGRRRAGAKTPSETTTKPPDADLHV